MHVKRPWTETLAVGMILTGLAACGSRSGPAPDSDGPVDTGAPGDTGDRDDTGAPGDTDPPDDTGDGPTPPDVLVFEEVALEAGLVHEHRPYATPRTHLPCGVGDLTTGAVAVADVNADGLDDLFFPVYDGADRLYLNRGDGTFEDVTEVSGLPYGRYSSSGLVTDLDLDGRQDLLIGRLIGAPLRAYVQQADGTFVDRTEALGFGFDYPADQCAMTWSLVQGDADLDGDLDIVMAAWTDKLRGVVGFGSLLWRRQDDGTYASERLPVPEVNYGFTPAIADLDEDGRPDLPLASDFGTNVLLWADVDGSWLDDSAHAGVDTVEAGMGSALLDLDGDGDLDWFVTAVYDDRQELPDGQPQCGNKVYLNQGGGAFIEGAQDLGLHDSGWAWGVAVSDLDLDGVTDLAVTNGYDEGEGSAQLYRPFMQDPTRLYTRGAVGEAFVDVAAATGLVHGGQGRAIVYLDLEDDGDDDLLIVNQTGPVSLFRNDLDSTAGSLTVRLFQPGANPRGLGSQVWVQHDPDGPEMRLDVHGNSAFLSQEPPRVRVGLGAARDHIHRVRVVWPDGEEAIFEDVEAGSLDVRR